MLRRKSLSSWTLLAGVLLLGSGCGVPFVGDEGPTAAQRRAECDGLAAQAIDAEDLAVATRLAARASDCYAQEARRR